MCGMFKCLVKLSGILLFTTLISACSGVSNKDLDYNEAKKMPGYGYVFFDFSKSNDIDYGRDFVPGKTSYTISYVNDSDILFVDVNNVGFEERVFEAYIPYMKGYRVSSVWAYSWYPNGNNTPYMDSIDVNIIDSISQARCEEATYRNNEQFEFIKGCNNMEWIDRSKKSKGSILVTPHFYSGFGGMFTPYLKPEHSSAGS